MNYITEMRENNLLFLLNLLQLPYINPDHLGALYGVQNIFFALTRIIKKKKRREQCGNLFKSDQRQKTDNNEDKSECDKHDKKLGTECF